MGEMSVQSMEEVGKDFCTNFTQTFLENIHRRKCNGESLELIPPFHSPNLKSRPSPPALYSEVYSENVSSGRAK